MGGRRLDGAVNKDMVVISLLDVLAMLSRKKNWQRHAGS